MPIFKEYFPSYFELEFETIDDLLNFDCIKKWTENPWGEEFYRFSINHNRHEGGKLKPEYDYITLKVEMNNGERCYILGEIYGSTPEEIGLPVWKYVREKNE